MLAPNGHAAMSELSLLSGVNRTPRLRPPTSEFDPKRTRGSFRLRTSELDHVSLFLGFVPLDCTIAQY